MACRSTLQSPGLRILSVAAVVLLAWSCAQQGNLLTGGPKDEKPPVPVESEPANLSTGFRSDRILIRFDEYFQLKDIQKQLVVSPPMLKKPEFKVKGKELEIRLKDSLVPDRTYAINFGNALVDLNESNPIKNYQFVFSTGNTIDSLEASGVVRDAVDGKPVEDALVMLYDGTEDSLPLKTMPLYCSRTDKEGKFILKNLGYGSYKLFVLKDINVNYLFDQPTEAIAFSDTPVVPSVIPVAGPDSAALAADTLKPARDSAQAVKDTTGAANPPADTVPPKPKYRYLPDNLSLRLFTEAKPNRYINATDRPRRDQLRLTFSQKTDTLGFEFLDLPHDSVPVALEWTGEPDTLDFWILGQPTGPMDSLKAIFTFTAFDSVERPYPKQDTVKFRFRQPAKAPAAKKNEFTLTVPAESSKTLEYSQPLYMTASLPVAQADTSLIRLYTGKGSAEQTVPFVLRPDTLRGLVLNGKPLIQTHPRRMILYADFLADSSYRLALRAGAFTGSSGQKSDSSDIRFKVKSKELYGSLKIGLPQLKEPAILQLIDGKKNILAERQLEGPGTAGFDLLAPGKYSVRLVFDANRNGRWDTGRYLRHEQPEKVMTFNKELNVKANWEVSETWEWEDL